MPKPYETPVDYIGRLFLLPDELKRLKGFVLWKLKPSNNGKKPGKVPYYIDGTTRKGTQGSPKDRERLATFADAANAFESGSYTGIGLAMLPEWGITAIDLDSHGKPVDPELQQMVVDTTYSERSPGLDGIRAFYKGSYPQFQNPDRGIEIYDKTQFLTVTGEVLNTMGIEPMPNWGRG